MTLLKPPVFICLLSCFFSSARGELEKVQHVDVLYPTPFAELQKSFEPPKLECDDIDPQDRIDCEFPDVDIPDVYCIPKGCCYDSTPGTQTPCFDDPQAEGRYNRVPTQGCEDQNPAQPRVIDESGADVGEGCEVWDDLWWCHNAVNSFLTFDLVVDYPIEKVLIYMYNVLYQPRQVLVYAGQTLDDMKQVFDFTWTPTSEWVTLEGDATIPARFWRMEFIQSVSFSICVNDIQFYFPVLRPDEIDVTGRSFLATLTPDDDPEQRYVVTTWDEEYENIIFEAEVVGMNIDAVMVGGPNLLEGATNYPYDLSKEEDPDYNVEYALTHCGCSPPLDPASRFAFLWLGCYTYDQGEMGHEELIGDNNNNRCSAFCRDMFPDVDEIYAMTRDEICICSEEHPSTRQKQNGHCDHPCPGDPDQKCGAITFEPDNLVSVYRANTYFNSGFFDGDPTHIMEQKNAGAPSFYNVTQEQGGLIFLNWFDSSTCEDRFEYRRVGSPLGDEWHNVFKYSKELATTEQCGFHYSGVKAFEEVGTIESDNGAQIQFGNVYTFQLRTNMLKELAQQFVRPSTVEFQFRALWEAVLSGTVNSFSGTGVAGVRITAVMNDIVEEDVTDHAGSYEIFLTDFVQEFEQSVQVTPYMESNGLEHKFNCPDGNACETITWKLKHDSHLSGYQKAAQVLDFTDTTVVDISGRVVVKETLSDLVTCGEPGATVCVFYIQPPRPHDEDKDCVESNAEGEYVLQVPMGLDVIYHVNATFPDHIIMTQIFQNQVTYVYEGDITQDRADQNFDDLTERYVEVQVIGGRTECNATILDWLVAASPINCPDLDLYLEGGQSNTMQRYLLGAQEYSFRLLGDEDPEHRSRYPVDQDGEEYEMEFAIEDVTSYFQFERPILNLTGEEDLSIPPPSVRFEFHLESTISVEIAGYVAPDCGDGPVEEFYALESGENYEFTVIAQEMYSLEAGYRCIAVEGDLRINGLPQGGVMPPVECTMPETGYSCEVPVVYSSDEARSYASFYVTPVEPSTTPKGIAFTLTALVSDENTTLITPPVTRLIFVMGHNEIGEPEQIPLPEHVPIFILREPPGDHSFSQLDQFTEIQVDIKVESDIAATTDTTIKFNAGIDGEKEIGVCLGVVAEADVLKIEADFASSNQIKTNYVSKYTDTATIDVTLSESFRTPGATGTSVGAFKDESDMFLCPAFNVEFSLAQIFFVNETTCLPDFRNSRTWSLPDELRDIDPTKDEHAPENLFAWYSEWHIRHKKLPELVSILDTHQLDCVDQCYEDDPTDDEIEQCLEDCEQKKLIVEDAVVGWQDTLNLNEELKEEAVPVEVGTKLAGDRKLTSLYHNRLKNDAQAANHEDREGIDKALATVHKYEKKGNEASPGSDEHIRYRDGSNLIVNALEQYQAKSRNTDKSRFNTMITGPPGGGGFTTRDYGGDGVVSTIPEHLHQMAFSGGGSSYSFKRDSQSKSSLSVDLITKFDTNSDLDASAKAALAFVNAGAGTDLKFTFSTGTQTEDTWNMKQGTTTSFTFQDDDIGDDFTVAILQDRFGWLYFETVGGKSSCPRENNTIAREEFEFQVDLTTNPDGQFVTGVPLGEPVRWDIEITNRSPTGDSLPMMLKLRHNPGGLITFANGLPFETHPRTIALPPQERYVIYLTAERPQTERYDFELELVLSSACEDDIIEVMPLTVEWNADCPAANFLRLDPWLPDSNQVLLVTAVNPVFRTNPWPPTDDDKELDIFLMYRMPTPFGTVPFEPFPEGPNFAFNQSNGRTVLEIQIDETPVFRREGDYELMFHSRCMGYSQPEALSEVWRGAVDHEIPEIVHFPEPQDQYWELGDELSFQFDEAILPELGLGGESRLLFKEDPDDIFDELRNVPHEIIFPHNGEDGKIIFNVNNWLNDERGAGLYYQASLWGVEDIHGNRNDEFFRWEFQAAPLPSVDVAMSVDKKYDSMLLKADSESYVSFSLHEIEPVVQTGDGVECGEDKVRLSDGLFAEAQFDFGPLIEPGSHYTLYCDVEKGGVDIDPHASISIWQRTPLKMGLLKGGPWSSVAIPTCSPESCLVTFRFKADNPQVDSHPFLSSKMKIVWTGHQEQLSEFHSQLAMLLEVSDSRVQLTNVARNGKDPEKSRVLFSVHPPVDLNHITSQISAHAAAYKLEAAVKNPEIHQDLPGIGLTTETELQIVREEIRPVCKMDALSAEPRIIVSKSGFSEGTLSIVIQTSVQFKEISFQFPGASNSAAQFHFSSNGIPPQTPLWSVDVVERCWREFTLSAPWTWLSELDMGGFSEHDSGVYEGDIQVDMKFDDRTESRILEFSLVEEFMEIEEEVELCHVQLLASPCASEPVVENAEMTSCAGLMSGEVCDLICSAGYIASKSSLECADGIWEQGVCEARYFTTEALTFNQAWDACSTNGGHLATIHSEDANDKITKLCQNSVSGQVEERYCYIGLRRKDEVSFEWITTSRIAFENWDVLQPSHLRQPQETVGVIDADTGLWSDRGQGMETHVAICEHGLCVPSTSRFASMPESSVSLDKCLNDMDWYIENEIEMVWATDGCSQWHVDPHIEIQKDIVLVEWIYEDLQTSQMIEFVDSGPVLQFQEQITDVEVECGEAIPQPPEILAIDHCDDFIEVQFEEASTTTPLSESLITRTWTATDSAENTIQHTQQITVKDTTPPKFSTLPSDESIDFKEWLHAMPVAPPEAEDLCSGQNDIQITFEDSNPIFISNQRQEVEGQHHKDQKPKFSVVRTWIATDSAGLVTLHEQQLTITKAPHHQMIPILVSAMVLLLISTYFFYKRKAQNQPTSIAC